MTAKFGSFFEHAETGEKRQNVISSFTQDPISVIFAIHFINLKFYLTNYHHIFKVKFNFMQLTSKAAVKDFQSVRPNGRKKG